MAWAKGQSGNPGGSPRDKVFTEALRLAANEEDPVTKKRKLRRIAEKLVECALDGESWAIQQVADRLDGKPAQTVDATVLHGSMDEMTVEQKRERATSLAEQLGISHTSPVAGTA